jgi:hypothetical protein
VIFEPAQQGTVTDFTILDVADSETSSQGATSKRVIVSARVRLPDGEEATKRIFLLLQRRDRWIVTGFTVAGI